VLPVLRFKNPQGGAVVWDDKVKGRIEISNDELDDLVIAGQMARRPTTSVWWLMTSTWRSRM